jgi:biotin operon repressor
MSDPFADARDAWLFRALAHDGLLPSEKNVAAYLALRFNRKAGGVAWPSLETIAHDVGVARSTAAKAIDRLKSLGFIEVKSGGGRRNPREGISNQYRMLPSDPPDGKEDQPSDGPDCKNDLPSDAPDGKDELPSENPGSYRPTHRTEDPDRTPDKESLSKKEGLRSSGGRRRLSTPAPETISVEMTEYAVDKGWSSARAAGDFEKFRDYHLAKGNTYADWLAAWRTWVRRGVAYDQPPPQAITIDQHGNDVAPTPNRGAHGPPVRRQTNTERLMAGGR